MSLLDQNTPFRPNRFPFFYGWVMVAASTAGILSSIPGQTIGVGVFTDYLLNVLNISRTALSTAYMIGTITSSLLLPFAGRFLDQFGNRLMVMIVSAGLGVSLMILSHSDHITQSIGFQSIIMSIGVMSICFFLIRFFGQGCLAMISRVNIGKWFNHRRGLATGIMGILTAFGFNSSPMLLNSMVSSIGWRETYYTLAILVGVGMSIVGWIFYRDNPEQCGLVMDGISDESKLKKMAEKIPETRKEFTRAEAIRTLPFWAFSLAISMIGMIVTAVTFHIASIGSEMGLTRSQSFSVFLPMAFFSVFSNFFSSWISDRIQHKWLLIASMVAQAISLIGLLQFNLFIGRLMFIGGQGTAMGMFVALSTVVYPRFFGRTHLGSISGLVTSILVFGSAIGPVLFSGVRGLTGSYQVVILICFIFPLVLGIIGLKADNPQSKISVPDQQ